MVSYTATIQKIIKLFSYKLNGIDFSSFSRSDAVGLDIS